LRRRSLHVNLLPLLVRVVCVRVQILEPQGVAGLAPDVVAEMQRRMLNLKAKFESGSSHFSFKRLVTGAFNVGLFESKV